MNFKKVLEFCTLQKVDGLFLLGNLFNSSSPNNTAQASCVNSLRKHTFAEAGHSLSSSIRVEGIRESPFESSVRMPHALNFTNPSLQISLPIFAIHGTKDQPDQDSKISPLEILHQSNLVNYFGGKFSLTASKIQHFYGNPSQSNSLNINALYRELKIEPVKISKPDGTKLALYFLPHIPERLLSVLLKENKILFTSPCDDSYAMVLFLHQKRSKASAPSPVVPCLEIHHLSLP